jgi:hypothetical protein
MASKDALQLVDYLTSTMPSENQSFDDYMNEALARWPTLSQAEVAWAVARAASLSGTGASRSFGELRQSDSGVGTRSRFDPIRRARK